MRTDRSKFTVERRKLELSDAKRPGRKKARQWQALQEQRRLRQEEQAKRQQRLAGGPPTVWTRIYV